MSPSYREQRELRRIEADLLRSDSRLGAMLGMFGRLYIGQGMPAWEQVPGGQGGVSRVAVWIELAFAVAGAVIGILLRTAPARVSSVRRAHARPSATRRERTGPGREADDQQNPAG